MGEGLSTEASKKMVARQWRMNRQKRSLITRILISHLNKIQTEGNQS